MSNPNDELNAHYQVFRKIIDYAEANYPGRTLSEKIHVLTFPEIILKMRKAKNPHKIDFKTGEEVRVPGKAIIQLPNSVIENLEKGPGLWDAYYIVRIRRSVLRAMTSPIIRPGEKRF